MRLGHEASPEALVGAALKLAMSFLQLVPRRALLPVAYTNSNEHRLSDLSGKPVHEAHLGLWQQLP